MIKLKKAAGSTLATSAFHLEYQGGKLSHDDMNAKLSDLGLREGDEVIVRTE
jgi:aminoglycoside N3'-acetyltransferase